MKREATYHVYVLVHPRGTGHRSLRYSLSCLCKDIIRSRRHCTDKGSKPSLYIHASLIQYKTTKSINIFSVVSLAHFTFRSDQVFPFCLLTKKFYPQAFIKAIGITSEMSFMDVSYSVNLNKNVF